MKTIIRIKDSEFDVDYEVAEYVCQLEAELNDQKDTAKMTAHLRRRLIKDGLLDEEDDDLNRIKQLEEDIQEYKDVIDSLKQKLDATECLCEDFKAENEGYRNDLPKYGKKIEKLSDENKEWKLKYIAVCEKKDILEYKLENHGPNGHNITNEQFVNLRNENKALKEFIKGIKCELDVMNAKL